MAICVGLALGSNLGDRLANLREARRLLRGLPPAGVDYEQAPIYQSAPLGCPPDSPDFYNTVVELEWVGDPYRLLRDAQAIEHRLGRDPAREPNSPRPIDIDILYFDALVLDDPLLVIPHPRLTHRRFVLRPLADIRPGLVLPGDEVTITEHLRRLDSGESEPVLVQVTW